MKITLHELNLKAGTLNRLTRAKITTIDQLGQLSLEQLSQIHGLSKAQQREIIDRYSDWFAINICPSPPPLAVDWVPPTQRESA